MNPRTIDDFANLGVCSDYLVSCEGRGASGEWRGARGISDRECMRFSRFLRLHTSPHPRPSPLAPRPSPLSHSPLAYNSSVNPLQAPERDSPLLQQFLRANGIDSAKPAGEVLARRGAGFCHNCRSGTSRRSSSSPRPVAWRMPRRHPREVLHDHAALGTGGTCFALTAAMLHLVRALGWQAEPILADRRYGADTRSTLLVWIDGKPHLLDPGYLIVRPLPLPADGEIVIPTPFNQLLLTVRARRQAHRTVHGAGSAQHLSAHVQDDAGRCGRIFACLGYVLRCGDAALPGAVAHVEGDKQFYLQKQHLLVRGAAESRRRKCRRSSSPRSRDNSRSRRQSSPGRCTYCAARAARRNKPLNDGA